MEIIMIDALKRGCVEFVVQSGSIRERFKAASIQVQAHDFSAVPPEEARHAALRLIHDENIAVFNASMKRSWRLNRLNLKGARLNMPEEYRRLHNPDQSLWLRDINLRGVDARNSSWSKVILTGKTDTNRLDLRDSHISYSTFDVGMEADLTGAHLEWVSFSDSSRAYTFNGCARNTTFIHCCLKNLVQGPGAKGILIASPDEMSMASERIASSKGLMGEKNFALVDHGEDIYLCGTGERVSGPRGLYEGIPSFQTVTDTFRRLYNLTIHDSPHYDEEKREALVYMRLTIEKLREAVKLHRCSPSIYGWESAERILTELEVEYGPVYPTLFANQADAHANATFSGTPRPVSL
jgi:hypothetical protein